ncbi:DDB1- and CUL4-associated factor 5 [Spea bombifrons]|uniref:DDB1- and CUL4-associated factor 5 n=1 Tax=Spea bombifrons TaxID=233779 RepID=UPI00234AF985|nr:DDB1- and CUL4-associated factor 5 [Spea bombifrons]
MRRNKGCGMLSVAGFLSRRELHGDPLLKEDFQRRRLQACRNLYKKDLLGHFGCVNAIEFSNSGGSMLVSGGDDRRVLLWHMEEAIHSRANPIQLKGEHHSNIFCLAFNSGNTRVFSGGNDEQVILHDVESGETLDVFAHEEAVYGLSVSPVNDNVFASSSDDGRVLIWDIRESQHGDPFCLAHYPSAFHSVMFNPVEPRLLATANSKEGVGLWDIRKPHSSLLRYGGNLSLQSAMSVRFNSNGTQLLALRRRLPPVLYDIHSRLPVFQFDNQGYFNSCTMKSCCFAGDRDQYILSGSDDFNLYMWKIPSSPEAGGAGRVVNGAFMVLKGHRSIVNQVRFNPDTYMICSSGVEKIIKIWSPYKQPGCSGDLNGESEDDSRSLYTHEEYIGLVLNSGSGLSHDYASQSVQEDPRMMAFFDSLVRREIEGWSSDSDSDSTILQLHPGVSERSAYSDSESSASLPPSPVQTPGLFDETVTAEESQRSAEFPSTRQELSSHELHLLALRRYNDKRLCAPSNNSDTDENACETETENEPLPRPQSPIPEEELSSTSSSDEESNLNDRRATMRQRNALRHRQKVQREERVKLSNESATTVVGEDVYDYPQLTVDELSTSSDSSPERSRPKEVGRKSSFCSSINSVERKIYKAYKWLQYSYTSYSKGKDGEPSNADGEGEEGRPGCSGRRSVLPHSNDNPVASPAQGDDVSSDAKHSAQRDSTPESLSTCQSYQGEKPLSSEDLENTSQDSGSVECPSETKKLNGVSIHREASLGSEGSCGQCGSEEAQSSQNYQQTLNRRSPLSREFPPPVNTSIDHSIKSQEEEEVEGDQTDILCTHHSNGHLHCRSPVSSNSRQSRGGGQEAPATLSCFHSNLDSAVPSQGASPVHRDSCLTAVGTHTCTKEVFTDHTDAGGYQASSGVKRHRPDHEEPGDSFSEKKRKT